MNVIRVNIVAEGQTEMEFCRQVLNPHFNPKGIFIESRCVKTSRNRHKIFRGGSLDYQRVKADIMRWIKEEKSGEPYFSTMFDLYALSDDFPGFQQAQHITDPYQKVAFLENALKQDLGYRKFIPYIQLHEFESLLLANPDSLLLEYPDKRDAIEQLKAVVAQYEGNPELVNEGKETAPSKHIIRLIPEYEGNKVSVGAILPGIDYLEAAQKYCQHFREWLSQIEQLRFHATAGL
ncbi:DUF4276 family protein [Rhodoflexus caldus]|uniref:DUF4276 family protein n=1 Tax=Rhodoflexus caldus TaxID=2891236 RepID=UPI00202AA17F|nr:DUF4276 family protein [Rhodoflexus caldus]